MPTQDLQSQQSQLDKIQSDALNKQKTAVDIFRGEGLAQGSGFNSDKVDGIDASYKPMPNTLVPLLPSGKFPINTIPTSGGGSGFLLGNGMPTDKNILIADGTLWQSRTASGDVTVTADTGTLTLSTSGVTAATYGDSSHYPIVTVDAKGRITSASNQSITSTSPGGSTGAVQFNSSSSFAGDTTQFFWDDTHIRLGVGTNSPGITNFSTFHYITLTSGSSSNNAVLFELQANSNTSNLNQFLGGLDFYNTTNRVGEIAVVCGGSTTTSSMLFFNRKTGEGDCTERMRIDVSGNVSIGNIVPSYTLDVNGDINTAGIYRVGGSQIASTNLSDNSSINKKSTTIGHFNGYFRTESGLTLPVTFWQTTNDAAITIKRITVYPVVTSTGAGTGTVFRFTDGSTNCDVTLGPAAASASSTFTQNYASSSTLVMKVQSDDNATPPTDINMVVEYIIQ